jgi:23S rRNA pseudouridine1911/1915/1917 synthase
MGNPFEADDDDDEGAGALPAGAQVTVTIPDPAPPRLDKALAALVPEEAGLSRSRLMRMIEGGAVLRDGQPVTDPRARVRAGEVYALTPPAPAPMEALPEDIALDVVHEDAHLLVVDKPAGMVVHPAPGTPRGTLVNALLHRFGAGLSAEGGAIRPGIVHRIDKDTSGLLVVAKDDRSHQALAAQFAAHTAERTYLAVVHAVPDPGDPRLRGVRGVSVEPGGVIRIATALARHRTDRQRQAVVWEGGRPAVTRLRVLESFAGQAALVECRLETGRTHQIRVHLAHAGHGILGDPVYGGARRLSARAVGPEGAAAADAFPRQALHAATLGVVHPATGHLLRLASDLPDDMLALLTALRAIGPR